MHSSRVILRVLLAGSLVLAVLGFRSGEADSEPLKALGHRLFFEPRLSANGQKSCASCHDPVFAFSDGYKRSVGLYGDHVLRNAPSLINVKDRFALTWADDTLRSLAQQMRRPLFGTHPPEMGALGHEEEILRKIAGDRYYKQAFRSAFPDEKDPVHFPNIIRAIAAYEKALVSYNHAFDRWLDHKDTSHFGYREISGMNLFFSDRLGCGNCHNGRNLDEPDRGFEYANVGLYHCAELYPAKDWGLFQATGDSLDIGRFRIPSLRNVALTAPYFHDGSAETLSEVLDIYSRGGRVNSTGDCRGDGKDHPNRDGRMQEFELTDAEKSDLLRFLHALTDTSFLKNPYFRNPHEY